MLGFRGCSFCTNYSIYSKYQVLEKGVVENVRIDTIIVLFELFYFINIKSFNISSISFTFQSKLLFFQVIYIYSTFPLRLFTFQSNPLHYSFKTLLFELTVNCISNLHTVINKIMLNINFITSSNLGT